MKTAIVAIVGVCVVGGVLGYLAQRSPQSAPVADPAKETLVSTAPHTGDLPAGAGAAAKPAPADPTGNRTPEAAPPKRNPAQSSTATPSLPFQQALGTLLSGQSTFLQKQAAWQQMKDSGKLDQVITELEQGSTANPGAAEYPATLGQAYLQKAGSITDLREQGILGLKADQSFEAALNLDPSNWEAGFWKAAAMTYWPPQLGKGPEVIERFVNLMKLQEGQQAQPQFSQTYLLLGEQYQKQGYPDYARQIWQRGATLFPQDPKFAEKLSQPQAEQAAAR